MVTKSAAIRSFVQAEKLIVYPHVLLSVMFKNIKRVIFVLYSIDTI